MKTDHFNPNVMDKYVDLLEKLPLGQKLELISKLTESVKTALSEKKSLIKESLSELKSHEISEEILEEIRNNPLFNRPVNEF